MKRFHLLLAVGIAYVFLMFSCTTPQTEYSANTSKTESSATPSPDLKQFKVSVDDVRYEKGQVQVVGSTDLPDGAGVIVNFDVPKGSSDDHVGSDTRVTVSNGKFQANLTPKPSFPKSGTQVVEVLFTPRGQNPEVTKLVGSNGEYLTGSNVSSSSGIKVIEVVRSVNLNHSGSSSGSSNERTSPGYNANAPSSTPSNAGASREDEITRRRYEECIRQRSAAGLDTSPCAEWSKER